MKTRMGSRIRSLTALAMGLIAVGSAYAADVAGTWHAEFDTQIGLQKYVFTFAQDGDTITGQAEADVAGQQRSVELRDVKLAEDTITFVEIFSYQDNEIRIEYTGQVAADEIQFTRQVGDFATEKFVATRGASKAGPAESDEAPARPARRGPAGFGPPPELGPDDKPAYPPAPKGFDVRRDGIARGKVETVEYDSKSVGIVRKLSIYMPPGYAKDEKYPVLYLLHGLGGNHRQWLQPGQADVILDNLYADGKAVRMIVVMPNGRASADPPGPNPFEDRPFETYAAFEADLLDDVIPFVESHYAVPADRQSRAIAGLSMGGGQSLNFGLHNLDTFAWVGGFSSAPNTKPAGELIADPARANQQLRLLWVSCGDQDGLMRISQSFHRDLKQMNVAHVWHVDSGAHTFPVWKNDLYLVAQLLFRNDESSSSPAAAAPQRRAGRPPLRLPQPGPCPLPILSALPAYDDASFYAVKDVPHGTVEQATYTTEAGREKRMHIYLPPGYATDTEARYPVLYLNHGGGDDDAKWTSTEPRNGGHAQFILDNLIAGGKARPMIVVMPNTRGLASAEPPVPGRDDACTQEYLRDIIPYVESHYRARPGREHRALAGLSMGGFVVMDTGLSHLETFSELYVYSSGYFDDRRQAFEDNLRDLLSDPNTNNRLRVPFYMAAGETDIALANSQKTLAVLNKHAIRNFWVLSSGGHEWANWRRYLYQTAQIMFPDDRAK